VRWSQRRDRPATGRGAGRGPAADLRGS
jgi:hypothetical protein